ncbi:phosphonate C-P lyase system protein PhnL [Sneathiella limimaris]|uniref:phosphonate C-P lyase system protein PhnL n=1 Tax=Sneathiella limimaris TaxID=1964213 RepID=UPI00146C2FAF
MIKVQNASKDFVLHTQQSTVIPVFQNLNFILRQGDCLALTGQSGAGKSTFMRLLYANYLCNSGEILVRHEGEWVDMAKSTPHTILQVRERTMGYVSQFLRVIPRVSTLEIVAEPLMLLGHARSDAEETASTLLEKLNIPSRLWSLSPLTFSGGEQQRVNIARGFIAHHPILLLDEPTASLDAANRAVVLSLIEDAKARGVAILGIFHDKESRDAVCTGEFDVTDYRSEAYV